MARLSQKFVPPRERSSHLPRERALQRVAGADVAIVLAPPGYGKTSLLADLWRRSVADGAAAAWLTVDDDDEERGLFLQSLDRAARVALGGGAEPDEPRKASVWVDGANLADALISDAAHADLDLLLVLDNVHWLSDPQSFAALGRIMSRGGLRLALGGRYLPDRLAAMISWTDVALVGVDDLLLRADETHALFDSLTGGAAPDEDLCLTTEGWPAGVTLRALASRASAIAADPQASYMSSLCAALVGEDAARLARLSIFSSFTPELASLVMPEVPAETFLAEAARRCALIENDNGAMRFHPMLRDHLAERLREQGDGAAAALHLKASEGLLKQGMWREAVHHAIRGGHAETAAGIMVDHAKELLRDGDLPLLLKWCVRLKPAAGGHGQHLRMVEAWVYALTCEFPKALGMLDELEAEEICARDPQFLTEVRIARATALAHSDRTTEAKQVVEALAGQPEPEEEWVREVLLNLRAFLDLAQCAYDRVRTLPACRLPIKKAYQVSFKAQSWAEQGRLRTAHLRFTEAFEQATSAHDDEQANAALLFAFHSQTLFALGEHGAIAERWFRYQARIREACPHDAIQSAVIARARVDAQSGRPDAAQERLEQAVTLARERGWRRMDAACCAERARLWLRQGDVAAAGRLLARLNEMARRNDLDRMVTAEVELQARMTAIRIDTVTKKADRAAEGAATLMEEFASQGRMRRAMRARMLLAAALRADGDISGAERALKPARDWAEAEGARILLTLESPDGAPPVAAAAAEEAVNPLNPREIDVISMAASGRTNKEIARGLSISPETVKWHLKNIYGKLYVSNRVEAIAEVQRLGVASFA